MDRRISAPLSRRHFLARSAAAIGAVATADALGSRGWNTPAEAAQDRDTQTLTIMYNSGEITPAILSEFEKQNPGVKTKFINQDPIRLSAMLASGSPPDFVRIVGAQEMPNYAARGVAADLTPYFAKSVALKSTHLMPVNNVYRWSGSTQGEGSRYGMAKDWSPDFTLWFNKTLFDRAGVKHLSETQPVTYDELLRLAKRLTVRKHGKTLVYGLSLINLGYTPSIMQMLAQEGKSLFNHDYTQADFTTTEARRALAVFVDWAQAHVGPSPLDPDPSGWDGPPFLANRLAISNYGYWFGGEVNVPGKNGKPVTQAAMAPAPMFGTKRLDPCISATGAWIPASSKNKDLAWKFMEYFMAGQPAVDRAKSGWGVPSMRPLIPDMPHDTPYQKEPYDAVRREFAHFTVLRFSPYATSTAMDNVLTKYLVPVMKGQAKLDAAAAQITADVNKLLQSGKDQIG